MSLHFKVEGATKYSFTDEKTGRLVEGVNVFYLNEGDGENAVGRIPSKVTLPYESWNYVSHYQFPIECEVISEQVLTRKGIVTKVAGLKAIK